MTQRSDSVTVPVWHDGVETVGGRVICPECRQAGVVELSIAEMVQHMVQLGRDPRAIQGLMPPGSGWWWCHSCASGGVMVR